MWDAMATMGASGNCASRQQGRAANVMAPQTPPYHNGRSI
jgi:hypothetical protein